MPGFVYILASGRNGTLYVGVTSNLLQRVRQHKKGLIDGFTKQYGVKTLVHFETFEDISEAIRREKRIKEWKRAWKVELVEKSKPHWLDLFPSLGLEADRQVDSEYFASRPPRHTPGRHPGESRDPRSDESGSRMQADDGTARSNEDGSR